jgi:SAM-dependent methyltransferase
MSLHDHKIHIDIFCHDPQKRLTYSLLQKNKQQPEQQTFGSLRWVVRWASHSRESSGTYTLPCGKKERGKRMSDEANTYTVDHRSGADMQRLIDQDRLMNQTMGDLFPQGLDPTTVHSVLDVACGPAAWILQVAFEYPHVYAVGVDISQQMIDYGRAFAQVRHLDNVELRVMDVLRPWDFEDTTFDFVNARLLEWFLKEHHWLPLLQEMLRVTATGGTIRLTEIVTNETNSPAFNRILALIWEGWKRDGRTSLVNQNTYTGALAPDWTVCLPRQESLLQANRSITWIGRGEPLLISRSCAIL